MSQPSPLPALFVHQGAEAFPRDGRTVRVLASAGQRTAARLLDYLCVVLVWTMPPLIVLAATVVTSERNDIVIVILAGVGGIAPFVGWFLLRIGRLVWWGCTVGQRIAGIRVVALDGASNPSWRQAWKRFQPTWGGNSDPSLPTDDYFAWRGSGGRRASSGQCLHDKNAQTMVVLAEDTPSERRRRKLLGAVLVVTVLVAAGAWLWESWRDGGTSTGGVSSFDVDDLYETGERQEIRRNGRGAFFDPVRGRTLDDREGCRAGATDRRSRDLLSRLAREGRVEMTYRTTGGVLVRSHVLEFPDEAQALQAEAQLAYTDLRLPSGGPEDGRVGRQDRYLVVTAGTSSDPRKTENAVVLLQASTIGVIIWS